jgi:acyl-coenzyme A synthetase/AMP-(fatty) acid ligase
VGEPINPHAWEWYHQVRRYSGAVQGCSTWGREQYNGLAKGVVGDHQTHMPRSGIVCSTLRKWGGG